ncbi:MAG TPA: hypothetical protein PK006_07935 [Saprospiraceae bacterium]|nr:hypothetical protein [Saprospiraceae bacterium]
MKFSTAYCQLSCNSPTDLVLSGLRNTALIVNGQVIEIHGTVTLTRGASLNGCFIKAMPGSKLICKSTPIYSGTYNFDNTTFTSCSGTWGGIEVNARTRCFISNNCKIEKAYIGVKGLSGAVVSLENSEFLNNATGISLNGNVSLLKLNKCKFESTPTTMYLASSGIDLIDCVQNIYIGASGNLQGLNIFKNLRTGFYSTNSNFYLSNSIFEGCEYGVYYLNSYTPKVCNITGLGISSQLTFDNSNISNILGLGSCNLTVTQCKSRRVKSTGNNSTDAYHGIWIYWNENGKIDINYNKFDTDGLANTGSGVRHDMVRIEGGNTMGCNVSNNIHNDINSEFIRSIDMISTNARGIL